MYYCIDLSEGSLRGKGGAKWNKKGENTWKVVLFCSPVLALPYSILKGFSVPIFCAFFPPVPPLIRFFVIDFFSLLFRPFFCDTKFLFGFLFVLFFLFLAQRFVFSLKKQSFSFFFLLEFSEPLYLLFKPSAGEEVRSFLVTF